MKSPRARELRTTTRKRPGQPRCLRHGASARTCRGAATIEALLALLVFIVIWVGVLYMGGLYVAQLESESQARKCAWLISVGGCQGEIEGCSSTSEGRLPGSPDVVLPGERGSDDDSDPIWDAVTDPLQRQLERIFGGRARAASGKNVDKPSALGGGTTAVGATYSLPCNTMPQEPEGLGQDILDLL